MNSPVYLGKRYQLVEKIGTGGMAEVYRARDIMLERYVAIKILRADYSTDLDFQERFKHEARAAANLSHPNIVTVHDFGYDQEMLYIVMEYVPGTMLKSLIQSRGRFTPEEAIPLMVQACAGIGYAHRAGLVHCDVKPHNMLVSPDLRLKVTDFGIARALSTITPGEKSDVVWGSPLYFSPEQAAGYPPTPASDVYSLGVVLYEMLTGEPPFNARTAETLAEMHRDATPMPPSHKNLAISPALEQIILKTLSKEPSSRYRTADQLGRVLMNFGNAHTAPALALTPEAAPVVRPQNPPSRPVAAPQPASRPVPQPGIAQTVKSEPEPVVYSYTPPPAPPRTAEEIDFGSIGLGLIAFIAVMGLLPFWMYIIQLYMR